MTHYSIQNAKTGNYITHCDKCWFETSKHEAFIFTKEDVERVAKQLSKHYLYELVIRSNTGETHHFNALKDKNVFKEVKTISAPVKKSLYKFSFKK